MFKRTEEQEWTRFSKALSSRETEEATETEKPAGEAEAQPQPQEATAAVSPPPNLPPPAPVVSPPTIPRPLSNDVNVSVSRISQPVGRSSYGSGDVQSIIGPQTKLEGTLKSETAVRILGAVDGEIISSQSIAIEESAKVNARVTAEMITVAGEVIGEIRCAGRVEILPSGRVNGEIHAGTLVMQEGAFFEGHLKMGPANAIPQEGESAPAAPTPARARR